MKLKSVLKRWRSWLVPLIATAVIAMIVNPELRALTLIADALGYDALILLAAATLRNYGSHARVLVMLALPLLPLITTALTWMLETLLPRWQFGFRFAMLRPLLSRFRGSSVECQKNA